jgi:hypothetical protein
MSDEFTVRCGNCGADVPVGAGGDFLRCPFCSAALYVGGVSGVRRLAAVPVLEPGEVSAVLARRMRELEVPARPRVESSELIYLPFYRVERAGGGRPRLVAAAGLGVEDLEEIVDLGRELESYDPELERRGRVLEPELPVEDVLEAFGEGDEPPALSLIHAPLWRVRYRAGERDYEAIIDAVGGRAAAESWPPSTSNRKDRLLGLVALGAFAAFAIETAIAPSWWVALLAWGATAAAVYAIAIRAFARLEEPGS